MKRAPNTAMIRFIADRTGLPCQDIQAALLGMLHFLIIELKQHKPVNLRCFGSFRLKFRRGRKSSAFNHGKPQPEGHYVRFQASTILRKKINEH